MKVCQACRHLGSAIGRYRGVKAKKRQCELVWQVLTSSTCQRYVASNSKGTHAPERHALRNEAIVDVYFAHVIDVTFIYTLLTFDILAGEYRQAHSRRRHTLRSY
eukprot:1677063-Pyramimonas_sp.AAC.2